nr:cell division control protein 48 homolog B isoform X1 [Tanacetum cinerariifolium]
QNHKYLPSTKTLKSKSHTHRSGYIIHLKIPAASESSSKEILVLAATNRPYAINAALMRPGRFDQPCRYPDCLYLQEFRSQEDIFTKDEKIFEDQTERLDLELKVYYIGRNSIVK